MSGEQDKETVDAQIIKWALRQYQAGWGIMRIIRALRVQQRYRSYAWVREQLKARGVLRSRERRMDGGAVHPIVSALAQERKRLELGLQTVADALDCSMAAISKWESGFREPTIDYLRRYAETVGGKLEIFLVTPDGRRVAYIGPVRTYRGVGQGLGPLEIVVAEPFGCTVLAVLSLPGHEPLSVDSHIMAPMAEVEGKSGEVEADA